MKLVGRVQVEPLDDERWTNIERRVVTGASDAAEQRAVGGAAGAPWLRWAIAAAAVMVIVIGAGAIGWRMRGAGPGQNVPGLGGGSGNEPVAVHTDREHSTLDIGDATIASTPGAVFAVTRPDGGVLVTMTRGKVELDVGKRGSRPPLVVRAGETDVVVIGTHFSVDYGDGSGDVDVRVTEGVVRVVHRRAEARVAAGQEWTTKRGVVALAETAPPASAAKPATTTATGAVEIDMGKPPDVLHDRTARVPAGQPDNAAGSGSGSATRPTRPSGGSGGSGDRAEEPSGDLRARIRAAPMLPLLDVGTADPKAAIEQYTQIFSKQTGQRAAHALYSIAVLKSSRLGEPGEALETIDLIAKRFEGREYREQYAAALWLRVRIRCLAKVDDACRHAAYIYLHQAPGGASAGLAEQITLAH